MATHLKLSGVTAVSGSVLNLNGSNTAAGLADVYLDRGWSPQTANRSNAQLGGELYQEIAETIPLRVEGTTSDLVLQTIDAIRAAVDQGYRWKKSQDSNPVLVEYAVDGSTNPAVKTPLLGAPENVGSVATLSSAFNETVKAYTARIQVGVLIKGRWVGTVDTASAASAETMPVVQQVTMGQSANIPSLTKATFVFSGGSSGSVGSGYVALTGTESGIYLGEAEAMTPLYGSTEADSDASGGSVMKMGATDQVDKSSYTSVSINADARYFAILACMKNSHNAAYKVWADITGGTTSSSPIYVPANTNQTVYLIGTASSTSTLTFIEINVVNMGSVDSNNPLKIDYYAIVALSENSTVIAIPTISAAGNIVVDHQYLTSPGAAVFNGTSRRDYRGIAHFSSIGNKVTGLLMASSSGGGNWGLHQVGGAKYQIQLTTDRMATYLTPR